jgi:nucleotide-binding universal stress UspA family protein
MPDFPHVAVACALSPRFRAVLAEAWRFAQHLQARFSLLHAGERTPEKEEEFRAASAALGLPPETVVHWADGEPANAIIQLAKEHRVDLLVAGALERAIGPHFLGDVARELLHHLPCSLLLFTQPKEEPQPFRKIVVMTDYTGEAREALRVALHLAECEKVEALHVLSVFTPFTAARAKLGGTPEEPARHEHDEEALLDRFASMAADSPVPIDARVIHSTTGMGASDFTKTIEADLLVVPAAADAEGKTLLPAYMDWIKQVIPCNLWVVRETAVAGR